MTRDLDVKSFLLTPNGGDLPLVTISNTGSGALTINVTGGGTINGGASTTVTNGTAKTFVFSGVAGAWFTI